MAHSLTFRSSQFTYDKENDLFTTTASDLKKMFNGGSFYIRSERTGQTRLFLVTRREFSEGADREFVAWHGFCPAGGHKVVVFND